MNNTTPEQQEKRRKNRLLGTMAVLTALKTQIPEVWQAAYVVGSWVWVSFDAKPAAEVREALLDLGFIWNHSRHVWQHCCGKFSLASHSDPRFTYMTARATEITETQPVAA